MESVIWRPGDVYKVALFYRYVLVDSVEVLIEQLNAMCVELGLLGRILVSSEGINGTLSGSIAAIDMFEAKLRQDERFRVIDMKYSTDSGDSLPFKDLSVRRVDEIISCGQGAREFIDSNIEFDPESFGGIKGTGEHLSPEEFHNGVLKDDSIVLDIRNKFEYDIGHFEKAVGLGTNQYAETFDTLDSILSCNVDMSVTDNQNVDKPIYMYCTGGIRCEKASAYLKAKGFSNVYQVSCSCFFFYDTAKEAFSCKVVFTNTLKHTLMVATLRARILCSMVAFRWLQVILLLILMLATLLVDA